MTDEVTGHGAVLLGWISELRDGISNLDSAATRLKSLDTYLHEFQAIIDTFADKTVQGIVLVQDNKYIWANRAACDIFGYSIDEVLTLGPEQTTLPNLRDRYLARAKLALAGDTIETPEEWPVLRKDRTLKYVNSFAYRVTFLLKPALLVFFYDITESKKIQDELLMRAQILDAVSDSILLMEPSGKIEYVNDAVCTLTGYSREELLSMDIRKLAAPERLHTYSIRLRQFSEHKEVRYSAVTVRKDGVRVPVEIRGRVIKRGRKPFLLGVAREVKQNGAAEKAPDSTK